jgi:pimeloyl-ACP methyl ester carboxylesterase
MHRIAALLLLLLAPGLALAQAQPQRPARPAAPAAPPQVQAPAPIPILAAPTLAGITPDNAAFYARWTGYNLGRAIAFGPNGAQGGAWGNRDIEAAKTQALANCDQRAGGAGCALYAVDLAIVAPGREWAPSQTPPATVGIGSAMQWEIVPDARYLWRGPGTGPTAAKGAIVFGHGRGASDQDNRGNQPQAWVRHFNNAGFDVFRFDRHPSTDEAERAAAWLRAGLAQLRARGYGTIIMTGQSRGGWNSLQMLATPGLVDGAIAIAAAAHGSGASMNLSGQTDQFRRIGREAASPRARVAFVQFALDPFVADFEGRARIVKEDIGPRVAAVLVVDRPEGFTGHGAGNQWQFGDRFGPCLVGFMTEATPRQKC